MEHGQIKKQLKNYLTAAAKNLSLAVLMAVFAVSLTNCSKKDDPDVAYDEGGEGGSGRGGSGVGESDIGGGRKAAGTGLNTIYFDFDSASLSSEAKDTLDGNASYLKSKADVSLTVEGHCDERGSTEYNLALGERRANAVRSYLVNLGVKKGRLRTVSYGEERPAAQGSSENAWAKNRRAEFATK